MPIRSVFLRHKYVCLFSYIFKICTRSLLNFKNICLCGVSINKEMRQLEQHGITVTELVPLLVGVGAVNTAYLEAKRDRMGHHLPGELATGAITLPENGENL